MQDTPATAPAIACLSNNLLKRDNIRPDFSDFDGSFRTKSLLKETQFSI